MAIALAFSLSVDGYCPSTKIHFPPRARLHTRHWSAKTERQDSRNVSSDDKDSADSVKESPPSMEVVYTRAIMPRPHFYGSHPNEGRVSAISWEEVLLAHPAEVDHSHRTTLADASLITLILCGFSMSFAGLVHMSGPGAWRYYLAGGLCAAMSHSVPVPIDVVKTRKQVDPILADMNFPAAFRWMIKNEGLKSLWAGLGPTTLGYSIEGSIKFGVYEASKPIIRKLMTGAAGLSSSLTFLNSNFLNLILCGITSGIAASIALSPMEALRIRLVAQKDTKANMVQSGIQMLKNEGIDGLTRGTIPMLYKQVPYTICKNVSFDLSTKAAYAFMRARSLALTASNRITITVLSAGLSSILSCISSQPGDMLLSLMNAQQGERRRTRDIAKDILRSDRGIGGFFVGIKARFVHVGVIVTLQLFLYDVLKQLCGIAATGSA